MDVENSENSREKQEKQTVEEPVLADLNEKEPEEVPIIEEITKIEE